MRILFVLGFCCTLAVAVAHASDISRTEDACPLPKSYTEDSKCVVEYLNQLTELVGRQANEIATGSMDPPSGSLAKAVADWGAWRDKTCSRLVQPEDPATSTAALRCRVEVTEAHYVFLESVIEKERGLVD
jgi:uncharacterized protein YecT (DUF1311 family)